MVTGIEAAGLVLAIIPLILKQLNIYMEGIETIKTFRKAKYQRYLKRHATVLGSQQCKLIHTMELVLEDIVPQDQISSLTKNQDHPLWQDKSVKKKLRGRLGQDYTPFCGNLEQARHTLKELADELEVNISGTVSTNVRFDATLGIWTDIFGTSVSILLRRKGSNPQNQNDPEKECI